jgi:hypothetical protein
VRPDVQSVGRGWREISRDRGEISRSPFRPVRRSRSRFGDQDLFGGVVLNAALLLIGIWRACAVWPVRDPLQVDHFGASGTPVSR